MSAWQLHLCGCHELPGGAKGCHELRDGHRGLARLAGATFRRHAITPRNVMPLPLNP